MLQHHFEVYVPTTVEGNKPAHPVLHDNVLRHVKTQMSSLFDGFTAIPAHGGWHSNEHGLIEEPVTIVRSHTTPERAAMHRDKVFALARQVARMMSQEAVSVNDNGTLHFVAPEARP